MGACVRGFGGLVKWVDDAHRDGQNGKITKLGREAGMLDCFKKLLVKQASQAVGS